MKKFDMSDHYEIYSAQFVDNGAEIKKNEEIKAMISSTLAANWKTLQAKYQSEDDEFDILLADLQGYIGIADGVKDFDPNKKKWQFFADGGYVTITW